MPGPKAGTHGHRLHKQCIGQYDGTGDKRHKPMAGVEYAGCHIPCRMHDEGPYDNDNQRDMQQTEVPTGTIRIEFIQLDATLFGNPTGSGNEDDPDKKPSLIRLLQTAEHDTDGNS
jgi:hypothetical protein